MESSIASPVQSTQTGADGFPVDMSEEEKREIAEQWRRDDELLEAMEMEEAYRVASCGWSGYDD